MRNFTVVLLGRLQSAVGSEVLFVLQQLRFQLTGCKETDWILLAPLCSAPWKSLLSQDLCWSIRASPQAWLPSVSTSLSVCWDNFGKWSHLRFGCRLAELINLVFFPADVSALCRHLRSLERASSVFSWASLVRKCHLGSARWPGWPGAATGRRRRCIGTAPQSVVPTLASARASRQQRGSACPCKFTVELGGSLLCFALLRRAGAEHRRLFSWTTFGGLNK